MSNGANTSWSGQRVSFSPADRKRILTRAHHRCEIQGPRCTGRATDADHIRCKAEGGSDDWLTNGQAACPTCHGEKTRAEQARGRARRPTARRPHPPHPGLRPQPGG